MPKKHTLKSLGSHEFLLIGVITPLPGYRLCYFLNKSLCLRLARTKDLPSKETDDDGFQLYEYLDKERQNEWYLLGNKAGNQLLLPALKQFDYFLLTNCLPHSLTFESVAETIRIISQVQIAQIIEYEHVKGLDCLFEDFEMHIMQIVRSNKGVR
ncbi:MAG: IPExxxVDY family protein [Bacteroidales bacterium]|nr:IPExxxVDY family protein [Bacteroidales bacterium]MDZ4204695.1 IPExxxVDY family protein [Bacteroidales bacterium]